MPRSSREQRELNHQRILDHASRLVRERGPDGFSVPEVMSAAGLTVGGFYKHFDSKEALLAQASAAAFDERVPDHERLTDGDARAAARGAYLDDYLSVGHRDTPGRGCPASALAGAVATRPQDDAVRDAFRDGVQRMGVALERLGGDGRERALADLAAMVGAVVLARATAGDDISTDVLTAVRAALDDR